MDQLDSAIIKELTSDARIALSSIAKKEKVSESTIRKRVSSLEEKGVIMTGSKGILWIHNDSQKMRKLLNSSVEA